MNDVRDSRRKHLDELDKETEMKEMIERLKQNWTAFGGLTKEEQEFLWEHKKDVGIFSYMCLHDIGGWNLDSPCAVYRLRPDFQLPEPVKERWVFDTETKEVLLFHNTMLADYRRIEITAEQKAYLEAKPEPVEGFEWVLKVPEKGDNWMAECGFVCCGDPNPDMSLNGIRWTQVPVEPRFVEYPIFFGDVWWKCAIEHKNVVARLHELLSIVGFTGDVLFHYADGSEQWRYTLTDRNRDGTPATPIKARFYIAKKM
jgi:hypothetical protein